MSVIPRDKVLDKIRKLIALSSSSNIHEAEVAAAAAQRLMLEHKLAESDITVDSAADDIVMDREIYRDLRLKNPPRWHGILLHGVANANFCRCVSEMEIERNGWTIEQRRIYHLVGTEEDRAATIYLYEMLRREIERLCGMIGATLRYDRAERASFKLGAAGALVTRLQAEWQRFQQDVTRTGSPQALAVIDRTTEALELSLRRFFPSLTQRRPAVASRYSAYMQGQKAGAAIDVGGSRRGLGPGQKGLGDGGR